ncbi:hypothetical protein EP30_05380 [Bifidobacterium sp. UTCIF-39]|uniref:hypothetical protein n=1 Tax=Bifidobacterium sp. UTCIF-39 TaxID=1465359 RepID=UPI001129B9FE|nr:hypothetical protein [Bifidobacterium sp. UTCIF-39]TPF96850.1 hypothetical protein EP30_05380 [Bifidobacterium sp. UTCIF-39]
MRIVITGRKPVDREFLQDTAHYVVRYQTESESHVYADWVRPTPEMIADLVRASRLETVSKVEVV